MRDDFDFCRDLDETDRRQYIEAHRRIVEEVIEQQRRAAVEAFRQFRRDFAARLRAKARQLREGHEDDDEEA